MATMTSVVGPGDDAGTTRDLRRASGVARACRVTYWTGWLSPEMEGCSKEVFALKDHFPRSRIFGLSRYYQIRASAGKRYLGFNVRWYPAFRLLAPIYEAWTEINHIYGGIADWFFLRTLRHRPIVLTLATDSQPLQPAMYRHVQRYIVHSVRASRELAAWGFDPEMVRLIYPGIDLNRYHPAQSSSEAAWPRQNGSRLRVLFATAPTSPEQMDARGVTLLLDAAARLRDVEFVLLWRPWPETSRLIQEYVARRGLSNVFVSTNVVRDMTAVFHSVDATTAPFTESAGMKVCPTSLVESLACGKPLLISKHVGLADLVEEHTCGEVFEPTVDAFCVAVARLREHHAAYALNARRCAERHFDQHECFRRYARLYHETLVSRC